SALHEPDANAQIGASIDGGMVRRGDFLSHLPVVIRAPETRCCVLMAIRIDTVTELAARLDRTEIFALEERIAERLAGVLAKDDAFTIWLDLGFGVLVHRDNSGEVEELAKRICASVAKEPFLVAEEHERLTVSVGVALPPGGNVANGADRWFATAHAAQAIALRHGGNRHEGVLTRQYEPIPAERVLIIREWLQEAKAGENVMIEFQPVLPLNTAMAGLYSVHAKLRDYRAPLGGVYRREYLQLAREADAMVMIDRVCLFDAFEALEQERARGFDTRLLVPVELATLEGVPWRWLEAELHRHHQLADGLILELEANQKLEEPENVERMMKLHELGVRVGLSDRTGGLDWVSAWSRLPVDILRLQVPVVDAVPVEMFRERLAPWREQGRQLIVDSVENASDVAHFTGLGVDYLRGQGLAAIGPRLDFEFE
ncbi:MAG TPA: EAL domain-containing protein, partial [Xanthomonadaceae bacterium]|nr:EAL domain-containing protein [Xanthomonadaceae bacterium]